MIIPDYDPNPFDAKVSLFPTHHFVYPSETLSLGQMLGHIARGTYQVSIEEARETFQAQDLETYKLLKGQLPAFTPAGDFRQRKNTGLQEGSSLIHFDYDELPVDEYESAMASLRSNPYVLYAFRSPSGQGIKCGVACTPPFIDAASYTHAWHAGHAMMAAAHPAIEQYTDLGCKDLARLCYVSYDPDFYYAPTTTRFPVPEQREDDEHAHLWNEQAPWGEDEIQRMLAVIHPSDDDRPLWLRVGMALHSSGEGWARSLWDDWSARVSKYDSQDQDTAWRSFHEEGNGRKVSMGTIVHLAQAAGWEPLRATLKASRIVGEKAAPEQPAVEFDVKGGISAQALMRRMVVPARFLIPDLIPDGLTILAAPAKSYKSYFSLSLALATIGATDWCGTFPVEENGPVVFFGLESPLQQLRNRMHQLAPHFQPHAFPHTLTFFSGMRALPPFTKGLQQALEQIIDHYTPRLIVIDPLSYLYRLGRQDDLASATLDLLWPLAEMAASRQVAILADEHMRKRSKEDVSVVDQLAGSHIKAAVVHGLIMMKHEEGSMVLETTMRDAPGRELVVSIDFDPGQRVVWGYKGTREAVQGKKIETRKAQVYEVMQNFRRPWRVLEMLEHLGWPITEANKATMRKIFSRGAKEEEVLAETKRGEYFWVGQEDSNEKW